MAEINIFLKTRLNCYRPSSDRYAMACCPFHEDTTPSLSITIRNGNFRCFGCGASGDLATLIAHLDQIPQFKAIAKASQLRKGVTHG